MEELEIVVFANRKDFFFTKLCITSIRMFYPAVKIFLVKDKLNGDFSTRRLRELYDVNLLDLGKSYYGWAAAKIHFILNKNVPRKRYLCLDSDIVFAGKVLNRFRDCSGDFIFHPYYHKKPFNHDITDYFFDPGTLADTYPTYEYPGYFFNAGQTVVTPGILPESLLSTTFQTKRYPYFLRIFRCADQPILNMVMPVLKQQKNIEINAVTFMHLSPQFFDTDENNDLQKFRDGSTETMVHYAGDTRNYKLEKMRGNEFLGGLRKEYHRKLTPTSRWVDQLQDRLYSNAKINRLLLLRNRIWIELMHKLNFSNY